MIDLVRNALLAGIGAFSLSEQKARTMVEELIAEGKVSQEEGEKLAAELAEKAKSSRKEWEELVTLKLKELKIPTPSYLNRLEERIKALEAEVASLKKSG